MSDGSGTPMFPARDARLTPEAVAERGFTQVKRGYAESEVRAFLRMVSDDLGSMRSRERELASRIQELEARLSRPSQPPSDQDLIAALGEETARVLGQAREAALARGERKFDQLLPLCSSKTLGLIREFQNAVVRELVERSLSSAEELGVSTVLISGGVAANRQLRATFEERAKRSGLDVYFPSLALSTDNAAMIAAAAHALTLDAARSAYWTSNVRERNSSLTRADFSRAFPMQSEAMRVRVLQALTQLGF
jgi:DivIVA domain-containing protein